MLKHKLPDFSERFQRHMRYLGHVIRSKEEKLAYFNLIIANTSLFAF